MNTTNNSTKRTSPTLSPTAEIIRPKQLPEVVGFTAATARRLELQGCFPRRRRIGLQGVGWLRAELVEWRANQETVYVTANGRKIGTAEAQAKAA